MPLTANTSTLNTNLFNRPHKRRQQQHTPLLLSWLVLLVIACSGRAWRAESATARGRAYIGKGVDMAPSAVEPTTTTSTVSRPRVLMWIPVHVSEPTSNLEALVACTFKRHAPSLAGEAFDVLITLAGSASDGREADLARIVEGGVDSLSSPPPTVRTDFVRVDVVEDGYDRDQSKGARSSYVGPNAVFYSVMIGVESGKETDRAGDHRDGGTPASPLDGLPRAPSPRSTHLPSIHHRKIAPYAFVQVMETDCCALKAGWLDTLLEPMLHNPALLLSGSRPKATCFSPVEHGGTGCRVSLPGGAREHINGNAMYRVGPGMQALLRDAKDLSTHEIPFDLAMYLVRGGDQSHVNDHPRMYSIGEAVDDVMWKEPAYYGVDRGVAFVHAPRRLRTDGTHAVASRVDKARLTMAVVVVGGGVDPAAPIPAAAGRRTHLPGLATDVPRLRAFHASLRSTLADRSLVYIAMTWPAFLEASRLAPFRVLLANGTQAGGDDHAWPDVGVLAGRALRAASALARAGLTLVVVGTETTVVAPTVTSKDRAGTPSSKRVNMQSLAGLVDGLANGTPVALDFLAGQAALDVGTMLVGAGDSSADTLDRWAGVVDRATAAATAAQASQRQRHRQLRISACGLMVAAPSVALCRVIFKRKPRPRVLWE
jgi:hypothetical protein